jgi:tartrate-resistant acid phosphatase type 5
MGLNIVKFTHTLLFVILILILSACENFQPLNYSYPTSYQSLNRNDNGTIHFFVLSDWGFSGSDNQRKVATEMAQVSKLVGLNFILTCGDNFQIAGVDSVNDPLWFDNYENVYNDTSLNVPWHPALGNHDHYGSPQSQVDYSKINKNWQMPALYYTFVQKINANSAARFIVLDTQGLIENYQSLTDTTKIDSIPQYRWLKNVLAESAEQWIFVTGHHPVYSASTFHGDTYEMKKVIKPLLDKYKVDFYICGHDHNFEHAKDANQYTDYIVTGTGGAPRPISGNAHTIYSISTLGFTYISLNSLNAKLYFISADGLVDYIYSKSKLIKTGR